MMIHQELLVSLPMHLLAVSLMLVGAAIVLFVLGVAKLLTSWLINRL